MSYNGYLIKIGNEVFPLKYIAESSYDVTPDQVMDLYAKRDTRGVLHRKTASNRPPKIEFETVGDLTNDDVNAIESMISRNYIDSSQRMVSIEFYNPKTDGYLRRNCYAPDTKYKIKEIDNRTNTIFYDKTRYAFIGY